YHSLPPTAPLTSPFALLTPSSTHTHALSTPPNLSTPLLNTSISSFTSSALLTRSMRTAIHTPYTSCLSSAASTPRCMLRASNPSTSRSTRSSSRTPRPARTTCVIAARHPDQASARAASCCLVAETVARVREARARFVLWAAGLVDVAVVVAVAVVVYVDVDVDVDAEADACSLVFRARASARTRISVRLCSAASLDCSASCRMARAAAERVEAVAREARAVAALVRWLLRERRSGIVGDGGGDGMVMVMVLEISGCKGVGWCVAGTELVYWDVCLRYGWISAFGGQRLWKVWIRFDSGCVLRR
ncbi:hypothetical protein BDV95DRAFT_644205, partial [Massariosphaeria phaeospora]